MTSTTIKAIYSTKKIIIKAIWIHQNTKSYLIKFFFFILHSFFPLSKFQPIAMPRCDNDNLIYQKCLSDKLINFWFTKKKLINTLQVKLTRGADFG